MEGSAIAQWTSCYFLCWGFVGTCCPIVGTGLRSKLGPDMDARQTLVEAWCWLLSGWHPHELGQLPVLGTGRVGGSSAVHAASAAIALCPKAGSVLGWSRRACVSTGEASSPPPGFPLPKELLHIGLASLFLSIWWTAVPFWIVGWLLCS